MLSYATYMNHRARRDPKSGQPWQERNHSAFSPGADIYAPSLILLIPSGGSYISFPASY